MMDNLRQMAEEDGLEIGDHRMTANSHRALLLAEAAKEMGSKVFYRLNERIYSAFFGEGRNIGDEAVLREIAIETGVNDDVVQQAWEDPRYENILTENLNAAIASQVTGTPTFFFGEERVTGAVPLQALLQAAERAPDQKT
jgi:predicted DsbA family dithiol-disulfide isomerase